MKKQNGASIKTVVFSIDTGALFYYYYYSYLNT